jgi:uncharacterized protein DUF1592/uncharacterized protein DUF1588/uncharacterized protein DUF1595/uncharacterized protein DUF1585/uncharacterized protein DUF1587
MGFQLVRSRAVVLAIGMLAGCTGKIVGGSSGTGGSVGIGTGGTGNTGSGATTGSGGDGTASVLNLNGSPQYFRFVRLTNSQWGRAVQDVLKLDSPSGLEQSFQSAVIGTTDFSNNELVLDVNQESWASFQTAAETLAAQVTATDAALAKVYSGTDPAGFITTLGRRVYRRPLTTAEQSTYTTLYNKGSSLSGTRSAFAKGASLVIRAMLQSPYFLYRTEMGASGAALSGYEIAAKLSLWLRGTTPSDTLLDSAAGPGKLDTADGAATLATTMLGETTTTSVLRQFHGELLHFDRFAQISKVGVPTYNTSLNSEFLEVSNRFFDDIVTQGRGLKDILTSTTGYVGPGTAPLYGMTAPASGYVQKDLGPQRVGWFLQIPYLALYGFNGDPDSIHRGVTLNLDVLCATLGPPAANIPPIPPLQPGQTNRQRIDTLTSGCGSSCHNDMINPLGFSFEHFDGMGQFRDTENGGLPIDSSGSYTFSDGNTKSWSDAAGLMQVLASTPQTHTCYAKKLASFGLQRDIVASDMPLLNALTSSSMAATGSVKQMIIDLVRNDAFRTHVGGTP